MNDKNDSRLLMYSCFDRLVIKFLSSHSIRLSSRNTAAVNVVLIIQAGMKRWVENSDVMELIRKTNECGIFLGVDTFPSLSTPSLFSHSSDSQLHWLQEVFMMEKSYWKYRISFSSLFISSRCWMRHDDALDNLIKWKRTPYSIISKHPRRRSSIHVAKAAVRTLEGLCRHFPFFLISQTAAANGTHTTYRWIHFVLRTRQLTLRHQHSFH